jgi:hypothetical protein
MFPTIIPPIILSLIVGLVIKFILDKRTSTEYRITKEEYLICAVGFSIITTPIVGFVGWHLSRDNQVTFNEYLNGWESAAIRNDVACYRDGPCYWEYDCDPYEVYVSETCSDEDDNTYECGHYETRYHDCPYVKVESTYSVKTTVSSHTIAAHRFPNNPQQNRWRSYERIPDYVIRSAGTGVPKFWSDVWGRVESGKPDPVTVRSSYKNYILASDSTILRQKSSNIAYYQAEGVMPALARDVRDHYSADKVHFVGYQPKEKSKWQKSLSRLNSAIGTALQGDVQLVVVQSPLVDQDPEGYSLSLKAFWQDRAVFGKDSFSKNGIGIIIGTKDGERIAWVRVFTGMPSGNESMVVALENALKGQSLDPEVVVGFVKTITAVKKSKNSVELHVSKMQLSGPVSKVVLGEENKQTRFSRVGMTGSGSGEGSGFLYLYSEISPTKGQKRLIQLVAFIISCLFWVAAVVVTTDNARVNPRFRFTI